MKQLWDENYKYMKTLGMDSVSGTGSTIDSTKAIIERLPGILKQLDIRSMCDAPCGDFHWMSQIDLSNINYIGADIVEENIVQNTWKYVHNGQNRSFIVRDITADPLPCVDLIFCRDCLVHFSDEDVWKALRNICYSGSQYLMTTTFIDRKENFDIATGGWRPLNLEQAPFHFPAPIGLLNEDCPEQAGVFGDKCLSLWKVEDLRAVVV
jgi:hypothetical protein